MNGLTNVTSDSVNTNDIVCDTITATTTIQGSTSSFFTSITSNIQTQFNNISTSLGNYVTTNTDQTITANKTFSNPTLDANVINIPDTVGNIGFTYFKNSGVFGFWNTSANNSNWTINKTGQFVGTLFTGSGSGLTALNGSNISSGTITDARLSTNVDLLNTAQTITANKTFSNPVTTNAVINVPDTATNTGYYKFTNDGNFTFFNTTSLTNTFSINKLGQFIVNTITGNGSGLTTLNATNISSGTVADARLSTNVDLLNTAQTITANKTFSNPVTTNAVINVPDTATSTGYFTFNNAGVFAFYNTTSLANTFSINNLGQIVATLFTGSGLGLKFLTTYDQGVTTSGSKSMKIGLGSNYGNTTLSTGYQNLILANTSCLTSSTSSLNRSIVMGSNIMSSGATSGSQNVIMGAYCLQNATYSDCNVAIGCYLFPSATNLVTFCVAIGNACGASISSGRGNIALGSQAMSGGAPPSVNQCIAIGTFALANLNTGDIVNNVAVGSFALNGSGSNTAGYNANNCLRGSNNTALGYSAGYFLTEYSNNNTFLGCLSNVEIAPQTPVNTSTNYSNSTAIGYNAIIKNSNEMVLGGMVGGVYPSIRLPSKSKIYEVQYVDFTITNILFETPETVILSYNVTTVNLPLPSNPSLVLGENYNIGTRFYFIRDSGANQTITFNPPNLQYILFNNQIVTTFTLYGYQQYVTFTCILNNPATSGVCWAVTNFDTGITDKTHIVETNLNNTFLATTTQTFGTIACNNISGNGSALTNLTLSGNGSGLTNLNGANITPNTIDPTSITTVGSLFNYALTSYAYEVTTTPFPVGQVVLSSPSNTALGTILVPIYSMNIPPFWSNGTNRGVTFVTPIQTYMDLTSLYTTGTHQFTITASYTYVIVNKNGVFWKNIFPVNLTGGTFQSTKTMLITNTSSSITISYFSYTLGTTFYPDVATSTTDVYSFTLNTNYQFSTNSSINLIPTRYIVYSNLLNSGASANVNCSFVSPSVITSGYQTPAYKLKLAFVPTPNTYLSCSNVCGITGNFNAVDDTATIIEFYNLSKVLRGSISGTVSSVLYNTASDQRLKTNICKMSSQLENIKSLSARYFNWKDGGMDYGFIAQEIYSVYPHLNPVLNNDEYIDKIYPKEKDGSDFIFTVDYGKMTPYLWSAVQELTLIVEKQQKQIEILLSKVI